MPNGENMRRGKGGGGGQREQWSGRKCDAVDKHAHRQITWLGAGQKAGLGANGRDRERSRTCLH
eukprot:6202225-Pleurochrysis_carterae.AAC.1